MSLSYTDFYVYPTQILGIGNTWNAHISNIESFIIEDMEYNGESTDLTDDILVYFVFFALCEDWQSTVNALSGEQTQVKEFSEPGFAKMVKAWDIGVKKLTDVCDTNGTTVNEKYLTKLNFFV